jgi:proline iminopeptidase
MSRSGTTEARRSNVERLRAGMIPSEVSQQSSKRSHAPRGERNPAVVDVEGPGLVPDGAVMRERPTLVLVHGGPGSYDHSYFKPYFGRFAAHAQVVYLDLRDHGRSGRQDPAEWSFERCADDVRAFCDALGIDRPLVLGHSMGGFVTLLYGARHPGHARALILQSTLARFDLDRLARDFGTVAGPEVATLARRSYGGEDVSATEWTRVFAAFGPVVPGDEVLARRLRNPAVGEASMELLRCLQIVQELPRIDCPTLVCVGELDPVTSLGAGEEIVGALRPGLGRLEVVPGAGHFPWLDAPEAYASIVEDFIVEVSAPELEQR